MEKEIAEFLGNIQKERRLSQHTVTAYRNDLAQFSSYMNIQLGVASLEEIDHHDIRTWVISILEDNHMQPRSVNRKLSCLRSFYKFMMRNELLKRNPMDKVTSLKTKSSLPLFIEAHQMERLLEDLDFGDGFAGLRDRLIIELLYGTGMRRAELINLLTSDVDFHAQQLKVMGKRNKERLIPFTHALSEMMSTYLVVRNSNFDTDLSNHRLLLRDNGSPINESFLYQKVNKYLRLVTTIGKKSPHILRHTFATHMLNNGADINAIKEILGHSSLAATQVYAHNTIDRLTKIHKQAHPRA